MGTRSRLILSAKTTQVLGAREEAISLDRAPRAFGARTGSLRVGAFPGMFVGPMVADTLLGGQSSIAVLNLLEHADGHLLADVPNEGRRLRSSERRNTVGHMINT